VLIIVAMPTKISFVSVCIATLVALSLGCKNHHNSAPQTPHIAYISNGVASFWTIAALGAEAAGRETGVKVSVHMPAEGIADQKRIVEDLLVRGIDGIAISLIDAANQTSLVNEAASQTKLITHDSDAPGSNRLAYVGMDNYQAGRMLGTVIKKALPQGGSLAIFIGRVEQDNARKRRQGVIDEVLDRSFDPARYDPPGSEISGNGYSFVVTLTDQFDRVKAKANCEDALLRYPQLAGMIGLFAYNAPLCLEALKQTGKQGIVKLFSFDEADETLQGVREGSIVATVVQNPYEYGFQSVKLLRDILAGVPNAIPESKFIDIPARTVDLSNVDSFSDELKKKMALK
jgi:ribose transport system substrate-binding protein